MKNVDDIVNSGLCIGCAACVSLCPYGALETTIGDFGYPVPRKSPDCNDCGICLLECPSGDLSEEDADD